MNELLRLTRAISILALLGWASTTCGSILLHRGWWTLIPAFTTVATLVVAIVLHQEVRKA